MVEDDLDAKRGDARDLAVEHLARQPVLGDPEVHHPARKRSGLMDHDRMPAPREMPRD